MTVRLVTSRPLAVYVADDEPRRDLRLSFVARYLRLLFKALHRARAEAAARELRRHRHLVHKDKSCGGS